MAPRGKGAGTRKGSSRKKGGAQPPGDDQQAPQGKPMQVPTDDQINKAFEALGKLEKAAKSASGIMGEKTEKLCSEQHFDKKALKTGRSLDALPDERFRITWTHLKAYAQARGWDARANAQGDMFREQEPEGTFGSAGQGDDNVRQLRPARDVAEAAGGASTH